MWDNKETAIWKTFIMGTGIVSNNISEQAPSEEWVLWKEKIAHHSLIVNILPFIIISYFFPNDSTHYETFILSSSTSSATGDIVAVPHHFLPFVC